VIKATLRLATHGEQARKGPFLLQQIKMPHPKKYSLRGCTVNWSFPDKWRNELLLIEFLKPFPETFDLRVGEKSLTLFLSPARKYLTKESIIREYVSLL
jgi:hypothetical protein